MPRLQISVALSLLVHLLLIILLNSQYLHGILLIEPTTPPPKVEEKEVVTIREYVHQTEEGLTDRSLERPVETTTPDQILQDVSRPAIEQQGASMQKPPTPHPEVTPNRLPNPNDTTRPEISTPRSSPITAGVRRSRRETDDLRRINKPIPLPKVTAESAPKPPDSQATAQRRRRALPNAPSASRAASSHELQRVEAAPDTITPTRRKSSSRALTDRQAAPKVTRSRRSETLDVPVDASAKIEDSIPPRATTPQLVLRAAEMSEERTARFEVAPGEKRSTSEKLTVQADTAGLLVLATAPAASSHQARVMATASLSRPQRIANGDSEPELEVGTIRAETVKITDRAGANESNDVEASSLTAVRRADATVTARGMSPATQQTPGLEAVPGRAATAIPRARSTALNERGTSATGPSSRIAKNQSTDVLIDSHISAAADGSSSQQGPNALVASNTVGGERAGRDHARNDSVGDTSNAAVPEPATANTSRQSTGFARPTQRIDAARTTASATRVDIAAPADLGGLISNVSAEPGIPNRRARPESLVMRTRPQRFIVDRSEGQLAIDGRIDEGPTPAYQNREPRTRKEIARKFGGSDASERAVELGLAFLARIQADDGHWSLQDIRADGSADENFHPGNMNADTAATGLALLAFLGAGYTHQEAKYGDVVTRGINHLIDNQEENGNLFSGGSRVVHFYSHGIAAIALCEAYGMTRDTRLRDPALMSLEYIRDTQHPSLGGWRYQPRDESDTSVSGWQMMALKSGELAGLPVSSECYDGVARWLDTASGPEGDRSRYVYLPGSLDRNKRRPSLAMTAEGLLMRLYLGWNRQNANLIKGGDLLAANLPQFGSDEEPLRDAYYWYYATQVMFELQGEHWSAWNLRLRELLVDSQVQEGPLAGSWEPNHPVADRWTEAGGRLYVTAMHLLMLEVYYRHLPLYQSLEE